MLGVFAPQYYGSVYYYAALAACDSAVIDLGLRYDKRFKSVHRCEIAGTIGRQRLTVPVSRPAEGGVRHWSQMSVSSHGGWWSDHLVSLESAYGRTPYFEFYIDRLMPWLRDTNIPVTEFDRGLDEVLRRILCLNTSVKYATLVKESVKESPEEIPGNACDMRRNNFIDFMDISDVPYYQIRADKLGFLPGLSVIDLICNMGPESPLILRQMTRK